MAADPSTALPSSGGASRQALLVVAAALTLAPLPFGSIEPWATGSLLAAIGVAALLLARGLFREPAARWTPDLTVGLAFVALTAIGLARSEVSPLSLLRFEGVAGLFVVYACVRLAARPRQAVMLAAVMAAIATATAAYGLAETLSGHDAVLWVAKRTYRGSVTGTFINRNHFASFLALNTYVLAGFALSGEVRRRARAAAVAGVVVCATALALTLSRGGLLAALLVLPFFLLSACRVRRLSALAALLVPLGLSALLVGSTGGGRLAGRFLTSLDTGEDVSILARLSFWRSTLAAWGEKPLGGWGPGTFATVYPRFRGPDVVGRVSFAHNDYLELGLEQGALGLLGAAGLGAAFLLALRRSPAEVSLAPLRAGLVSGLAAVLLHASVDFSLKIPAVALHATAAAGLAVALGGGSRQRSRRFSRSVALGAAAVGLLLGARGAISAYADLQVRAGERHFAFLDWEEAATSYRRALALDPFNLAAHEGLARALQNRMKFTHLPDDREREAELKRERATRALSAFVGLTKLNPLSAEFALELAWLQAFLGDDEAAAAEYRRAVLNDPNNANVLYHQASFLLHRGHTPEGIVAMQRAVRVLPKLFGGKIRELEFVLKDPQLVQSVIPPGQPFLRFQYAIFLLKEGDVATSRPIFERAWKEGGQPDYWLFPYVEELARQRGAGAAEELLGGLPPELSSPGVLSQRVRFLVGPDGDSSKALALLRAAEERWPADAGLLGWRVNLELAQGTPERALGAVARFEAGGGACALAAVQRARALQAAGDDAAALEACQTGLGCEPDHADLAALARQTLDRLIAAAAEAGDTARERALRDRLAALSVRPAG